MAILAMASIFQDANAQEKAWSRDSKVLSIGLGVGSYYHLDSRDGPFGTENLGIGGSRAPYTGQFNLQVEWAVHDYVGLGLTTGFGGSARSGNKNRGTLNMPIGLVVNFHFYQLIDDKNSKDLHSDKLDIYAGLSVGSGFAVGFYDNEDPRVVPLAWGGLHAGIRWYFAPRVALNAEVGFGKGIVNVGFSFKL
jgi:hypothetical protein